MPTLKATKCHPLRMKTLKFGLSPVCLFPFFFYPSMDPWMDVYIHYILRVNLWIIDDPPPTNLCGDVSVSVEVEVGA